MQNENVGTLPECGLSVVCRNCKQKKNQRQRQSKRQGLCRRRCLNLARARAQKCMCQLQFLLSGRGSQAPKSTKGYITCPPRETSNDTKTGLREDRLCMAMNWNITCLPRVTTKQTKTGLSEDRHCMAMKWNIQRRVWRKTIFVCQMGRSHVWHVKPATIQRRASGHDRLCMVVGELTCPPRETTNDTKAVVVGDRRCMLST